MLSIQQIRNLANRDEFQKKGDGPVYIWVTGPIASGKTFLIEHLSSELQKSGEVDIFWDTAYLIAEVDADLDRLHHEKYENGFIITDNVFHDKMFKKLIAEARIFKGDFFLIEMARTGEDSQNIRDMSYFRMSKFIKQDILERSIFIRLVCSYEERERRNQKRNGQTSDGKYRKAHANLLQRFSSIDDFSDWSVGISQPIIVLDNS